MYTYPRKSKNGFVIIFKKSPRTKEWYALIQYRSQEMTKMASFLGSPGGMYEGDETSLQAAVREVEEETGMIFRPKDLIKFSEGKHCDWFTVIKTDRPKNHRYGTASSLNEIQDTNVLIKQHQNWNCLPAVTFGHFWMPINNIDKLYEHCNFKGDSMVMGGLVRKVKDAAQLLKIN